MNYEKKGYEDTQAMMTHKITDQEFVHRGELLKGTPHRAAWLRGCKLACLELCDDIDRRLNTNA